MSEQPGAGAPAPPLAPGSIAAAHSNGPKATPLFHNSKLHTLGLSDIPSAFDAKTGKLVWQKPAPPEPPYFGMAVSPPCDKDLMIVHPGRQPLPVEREGYRIDRG